MRSHAVLSKTSEAHLATGIAATTSTDHGGLHGATPPSIAAAGLVVNNRQGGLLQLGRQVTSGWGG